MSFKRLALTLIATLTLPLALSLAAPTSDRTYAVIRTSTGVSSDVLTIKQVTTNAFKVRFHSIVVSCPLACTVDIERGGTAASTTSTTPTPTMPNGPAAVFTAYHTSNAGSGSVIGRVRIESAGVVPLSGDHMQLNAYTADQYSIKVTMGAAGDIRYAVHVEEVQ